MADVKFSALPRATAVNASDDIIILQGGVLKVASRSLIGTSAVAKNFLANVDFTVNQPNTPGVSNYAEQVTRTSATRLTKTGTAEAVIIQFHADGEMTVGKSYKLSVDVTRVSGDGTCNARMTQDNVSNPDTTSRTIVTGTKFTTSVTFNPGGGNVGLGIQLFGGPGVWDFANWSCVEL